MRVLNKTNWDTRQMKRIFSKCLQEVRKTENHPQLKRLVVTVVWHRSWWIGGSATYNSCYLKIKMPRKAWEDKFHYGKFEFDLSQQLAGTFMHEVGHCIGIHHTRGRNTIENLYADWIRNTFSNESFPLSMKISKKPSMNIVDMRYGHVLANLERARTRFKRAKTLLDKWTRKVKYYELKLVAKGREKEE